MNTINERDAPPGCIAVMPEQFVDGAGDCAGCYYNSGNGDGCLLDIAISVRYYACWAEGRNDGEDVIFKELLEEEDDE